MAGRVILFDLDGTLIDTTELILYSFCYSWERVCGTTLARERFLATIGIPLREAIRQLLEEEARGKPENHWAHDSSLVDALLQAYRECNAAHHDRMAKPFSDIPQVVAELKRRRYVLGVVSSKTRELGLRGLQLCDLQDCIDDSVFLEDTIRHKPHPDPLYMALKRFRVAAVEAAYVGDSCHDMQAGKASGITTVAALWGPIPRAALEQEKPDQLAQSPCELLEMFP